MPYKTVDSNWSLTTPTARVLFCIAEDPDARVGDLAERTGLTIRSVHAIISRLEADGALSRRRRGRRTHYTVHHGYVPADPLVRGATLGEWLDSIARATGRRVGADAARTAHPHDGDTPGGDDRAGAADPSAR